MQFFILLLGVLIFSFYQFTAAPLSFNSSLVSEAQTSAYKDSLQLLQRKHDTVSFRKQAMALQFATAVKADHKDSISFYSQRLQQLNDTTQAYRKQFQQISTKVSGKDTNDTNYVFLSFVKDYLPVGLKGLLIAIIFLAAWGSIAAALNSLAASTVVDFHQRFTRQTDTNTEYRISRWYTFGWGVFCIIVAQFANQLGQSLIEAVNVLGSLFYGVILGIFLVAFYLKRISGTAVFWSAIVMEFFVIVLFFNERLPLFSFLPDISFLWMNVIGAIGVILLSLLAQAFLKQKPVERVSY